MKYKHRPGIRTATALITVALTTAGLLCSGPATAQGHMRINENDLPGGEASTSSSGGGIIHSTIEYITNNTYINIGPHYLSYEGSSEELTAVNLTGAAAAANLQLNNTGAGLGNKVFGGGTLGLYIPGTGHHLAVEVLLAMPLELTFETRGRAINKAIASQTKSGIPTGVPPLGKVVGTLMALPPNFTIVYRPWVDTMFQPYIGIGMAYMYTYDTDITNDVMTAKTSKGFRNEPTLYVNKPLACMAQLGLDVMLPKNIYLNADVRYIGCAELTAKLNDIAVTSPALSPTVGTIQVGTIKTKVSFEALIYSLNIGVKF